MDKLQPYLALLKKHHFWVLCVLLLGIAGFAWYSGVSHFAEEYRRNSSTLEGKFSNMRNIESRPNHPNQTFTAAVEEIHDDLRHKTYNAWASLYDSQRPEMQWIPETASIAELDPTEEIDARTRERFNVHFYNDHVTRLYDILQVLKPEHWESPSRDELANRYKWPIASPSSQEVRYAQEDLWVYRALLKIIAKTNEGARDVYDAPIRRIRDLQVPEGASRSGPRGGGGGGRGGGMAAARRGGGMAGAGGDEADDPASKRYVQDATAGTQFRMMPIRMVLTMHESKLPDLLANCANAPLPVEVREVQIRSTTDGGQSRRGMAGGGAVAESVIESGEVDVELRGRIYIYNPPDRVALGLPPEDATAADDENVMSGN